MNVPPIRLPPRLVANAEGTTKGRAWLSHLPAQVAELQRRWSLSFDVEEGGGSATCSFVAFVRRADGTPAALKLGLPHLEAEQEIAGVRFWKGDAMVHLLEADPAMGALLLERCEPGTPLSARPEPEQDRVLAALLPRLWKVPEAPHPFRPLSHMVRYWADCAFARSADWLDAGFARDGIQCLLDLARPRATDVLLATDLHSGNVLEARREPWLAIDPKPFVGDAAYDATQHLLNCMPRLRADPTGTVTRFCEPLQLSSARVRQWLFARLAQSAHAHGTTFGLSDREALELGRRLEKSAD